MVHLNVLGLVFIFIIDYQIHYWAKIGKAAFKAFVICLRVIGWDLEIYLAALSIICFPVFLWLNLYSCSQKKQWQIYLSCSMVYANGIVLDITKNSIQPILLWFYLSWYWMLFYHLCLMFYLLIEQVTVSEMHLLFHCHLLVLLLFNELRIVTVSACWKSYEKRLLLRITALMSWFFWSWSDIC